MGKEILEPVVTIAAGVIAVAILAVLVSQKAQTPQVIGAAGSAFSNVLSAATGPVTGATAAPVNTFNSGGLSLGSLPSLGSLSLNP
jgi:hypothetical protein